MGRSRVGEATFPGWARIESDLNTCVASGDEVKLTAVEALTVLGEVQRLRDRLGWATRILRAVTAGSGCWAVQQGYGACEYRGVGEFLAGAPRRSRWWRRV